MRAGLPRQHVRVGAAPLDLAQALGPLASLQGTWVGSRGWSVTALPDIAPDPSIEGAFTVLVQPYTEVMTVTALGGLVRNEGGEIDQFVAGLSYEQRVAHRDTSEALHAENGLWLRLEDVQTQAGQPGPRPPHAIARTASVPHGNVALLLGDAVTTSGPPAIPDVSAVPADVGVGAPEGYLSAYEQRHEGLNLSNPAETLRTPIADQTIVTTTAITVDSRNEGSVSSVPFVRERADATRFSCHFWIETVLNPESGQVFEQLQYLQVIDLEFHDKFGKHGERIAWPHVTINTMVKQ